MKLDSFFSRNSLFNRLLIVMACLVTLSMAFSAGVIFYIRAAWKDEMLLSHDSYISAWSETVDASLESISNAFIYLSRSEEIQRRAQNGYFQRNQTLKNEKNFWTRLPIVWTIWKPTPMWKRWSAVWRNWTRTIP